MKEKGFALITVLVAILLIVFIGGVYFYSRKEASNSNQNNSLITTQTPSNFTSKPTPAQLPQLSTKEASSSSLLPVSGGQVHYIDKECNLDITYPQITKDGEKEYSWIVDAKNKSMAVLYAGRDGPNLNLVDHSVTIFAQPPGNQSIFYSASTDIVCSENKDNLSLESFKEKYLEYVTKDQPKVSALSITEIGNVQFIPILLAPQKEPLYLGTHNNRLIEITNSNPGSGKLQQDAKAMIKNIKFINSNTQ